MKLLNSGNFIWQVQTLKAMPQWPYPITEEVSDTLSALFENSDPRIRAATVQCASLLDSPTQVNLLTRAFEDGHAKVRQVATQTLLNTNSDAEFLAEKWLVNNDSFTTPRAQLSMFELLLTTGLTKKTLSQMIESKSALARQYYDAMQILKSHKEKSSAFYLTFTTVSERLQQTAILLLTILNQLVKDDIILVVKAAINSADQQLIASACEAIKSIENKDLSDLLVDILQDDFELKSDYSHTFNGITEALNWCKQQDQWLNTCANRALEYD